MSQSPLRIAHLSLLRTWIELVTFFRTPDQVVFTFLLPAMFTVIFATVFTGDISGPPGTEPVPFPQYFIPGMVAYGILSVTFSNLAMAIAVEQHDGLLRRLSATPLPRAAYFGGKIGLTFTTSVLIVVLILGIGTAFYGVSLPREPGQWATFGAVIFLAAGACSLLGVAYTRLIRSASAAGAAVQPPLLVLMFISGVFLQFAVVPGWLQAIATIFPPKWIAQALRSVFLPEWVAHAEYGTGWETGTALLVLSGWLVGAAVLARLFFRWDRGRG
jgi:ABC-2 type transport system permease protein